MVCMGVALPRTGDAPKRVTAALRYRALEKLPSPLSIDIKKGAHEYSWSWRNSPGCI